MMLSEISQPQQGKYYMIPLLCGTCLPAIKLVETEKLNGDAGGGEMSSYYLMGK